MVLLVLISEVMFFAAKFMKCENRYYDYVGDCYSTNQN